MINWPFHDLFQALTLHTLLVIPEGHNITLHGAKQHGSQHPSQPPQPNTGIIIIGSNSVFCVLNVVVSVQGTVALRSYILPIDR